MNAVFRYFFSRILKKTFVHLRLSASKKINV